MRDCACWLSSCCCVCMCVCETAACAYTRGVETAELLGGKIPLADLDYREVRLEIDADIAAFTVGLRDDVTSLDGRSTPSRIHVAW